MARVKFNELRNLSSEELTQKRATLEKELFDLRQKKIIGQLEKPHFFKKSRRQIAQINTALNEKKK